MYAYFNYQIPLYNFLTRLNIDIAKLFIIDFKSIMQQAKHPQAPWINHLKDSYIFLNDVTCCPGFFSDWGRMENADDFYNNKQSTLSWIVTKTKKYGNAEQIDAINEYVKYVRHYFRLKVQSNHLIKDQTACINNKLDQIWNEIAQFVQQKYGLLLMPQNDGILPYERGRVYINTVMESTAPIGEDQKLKKLIDQMNKLRQQQWRK